MNEAVFDYDTFHSLIDKFAADLPAVLASHPTIADLAPRVERLLTVAETPFTIAVVGQMRSGKSSLLNALVGADLAVTGVNETTATINWFKHGTKEQEQHFLVVWKDRPAEQFPLTEIKNWIGDSTLAKATSRIEFFRDHEYLRKANIVDTPGTRSVIAAHTEALQTFLALKQDAAQKQDHNTRQEGESADAIIYVLPPVVRQSDADLLADFEQTTRIDGASPYNSMAVLHKWETLEADDAYADAQNKCERLKTTLNRLVSIVLPVSAPLAMAWESFGDGFWTQVLDLAANTAPDVVDDLLMSEREFVDWDEPRCALDVATRRRLLKDFRLPWPSFRTIVRLAQRKRPASIHDLRMAVGEVSGIAVLRRNLNERFLARSRMIKAFSVLSKAWEPCQIAASRLRNHKNRFTRLLEEAEASGDALSAAINAGSRQLEPVQRYVEASRVTVDHDLRQAAEALHRLGQVELAIKDPYDDMNADLDMLEFLNRHRDAIGAEWTRILRALFGDGGQTVPDRVRPLQQTDSASVTTSDIERAIGAARKMRSECQSVTCKLFEHAILRLEQIADFLERHAPQTQTGDALGE